MCLPQLKTNVFASFRSAVAYWYCYVHDSPFFLSTCSSLEDEYCLPRALSEIHSILVWGLWRNVSKVFSHKCCNKYFIFDFGRCLCCTVCCTNQICNAQLIYNNAWYIITSSYLICLRSGARWTVFVQCCCCVRDHGVLMFSKSDPPFNMFVFDTRASADLELLDAQRVSLRFKG